MMSEIEPVPVSNYENTPGERSAAVRVVLRLAQVGDVPILLAALGLRLSESTA